MADTPASPWLDANLRALAIALGTPVAANEPGRWQLAAAIDGPILQLRTAGGALVAAHSRRAPDVEAARLVDTALAGRPHPAFAIVIGAGLGYVVETLVARDPMTRVLVIEPDASGVAAFLGQRDWHASLAAGRLLVLAGPDFRGSDRAWRVVPVDDRDPLVVVHPVLAREYPDDVRRAGAVGARVVADARANAGAEVALAAPYLLNTIENLGVVAREGDVDALAGAFAGVPAIVAAAGPSLDRVALDLARLGDRALVIAVDTALRPLLARGISPHVAVAVDPSERNARHLSSLTGAEGTWLVSEPAVHPRAFPAFAGRTFVFSIGPNHPWPWLAAHGVRRGQLAAWGSVLVSAFDLAVRVGARPIAIVGADLAYTGGQPYCRGTAFEEDWAREVRLGSRLDEVWARVAGRAGAQVRPDLRGQPVPTLPHLVAFRDHLLDRIAASGVRAVNATGGGILHGPGLEIAALDDLLAGAAPAGDLRARLRERRSRSVSEGRAGATALQTALARPDTPQTLAALVPGVDGDRVLSSVARARAAMAAPPIGTVLGTPSAAALAVGTNAPVWLPEQTAALASLVDPAAGGLAPLEAAGSPPLAEVVDAARALLAHTPLAVGSVDADALRFNLLALPLSVLVPLAHDARPACDRFGAALTRWIAATHDAALAPEPPFWMTPTDPLDEVDAAGAGQAPDDLGRLAVGATLGWTAARRGRATPTLERVAGAIARSWLRVTEPARASRVSLWLTGDGGDRLPWIAGAALAPLARGLAGTIVRAGAPVTDPQTAGTLALIVSLDLETAGGWAPAGEAAATPARLLTPEPCAPCLFAAARDDAHAIVTRQDLGGGYAVDARGVVTADDRWPAPILAEAPWGERDTYAWSSRPGRLLVRDVSRGITHDVELPFTPTSAEPDGDALRFTARDGVWRWSRDGGASRIVETAPLVFASAADRGLDLAPMPPPIDYPRRRTRTVCSWSKADGLREAASPPLGPCWSRSSRQGWTAEALPDANLIRVSDATGTRGWVICDYPRTVAWAGGSLVIVTTGGVVLFVSDVRPALGETVSSAY